MKISPLFFGILRIANVVRIMEKAISSMNERKYTFSIFVNEAAQVNWVDVGVSINASLRNNVALWPCLSLFVSTPFFLYNNTYFSVTLVQEQFQ